MNVLALLVVLFLGFLLAVVLLFKVVLPLLMGLAILLVGLVGLVVYIGSIVWAFEDAHARGKPGWAVALLVAIGFWPVGLLAWIVFRPEKKSDRANMGAAPYSSASAPPPL